MFSLRPDYEERLGQGWIGDTVRLVEVTEAETDCDDNAVILLALCRCGVSGRTVTYPRRKPKAQTTMAFLEKDV